MCEFRIEADDALRFSPNRVEVPGVCPDVTVTVHHAGRPDQAVTSHNWVLTREQDRAAVIADGLRAGMDRNYVARGDHRILGATALVKAGQRGAVTFSTLSLRAGEPYVYFCSYPGHGEHQTGRLVVNP